MATTQISVEEYLKSSWKPDVNFIDGTIEVRHMGDNNHSMWQEAICYWFRQHATEWNIRIRPEYRLNVIPNVFLVPDVAVIDAEIEPEKIGTTPPLAVFEIWSSESSVRKLYRNLGLYDDMGVEHIWHVDPADGVWQKWVDSKLMDDPWFVDWNRKIKFEMNEISKLLR
jgi:Uma2 family endonuclease